MPTCWSDTKELSQRCSEVCVSVSSSVKGTLGFPGGSVGKNPPLMQDSLGRSPEEGMAAHPSLLAWRIPWTEEPGGLQYMETQRVRLD